MKGKQSVISTYGVIEFTAPLGRGFRVEKLVGGTDPEETGYDVLIARDGRHSCSCKGHARHNSCKHLAGILALIENQAI